MTIRKLSSSMKRRTKLALCIRVIIFIGAFTVFFLGSFALEEENDIPIYNRKLLTIYENSTMDKKNCTNPGVDEFPSDGFTRKQRQNGWIFLHCIMACYCFWLLAVICDEYFVPSIGLLCIKLDMKEDVAAATFMAAATSSPELFINCVGTFVTTNDLGIGTIVGSAVFNILAVPACCGLFGGQIIDLDWYPLSRDSLIYGCTVLVLISVLYDGKVMWYEALILVSGYILYTCIMYFNETISKKMRKIVSKYNKKKRFMETTEISPLIAKDLSILESNIPEVKYEEEEYTTTPWDRDEDNWCVFLMRWPITFLLWSTIPDCRKNKKLSLLTFILCIFWIGVTSYLIAFLITVVGDTINIPDSVMGLTFLAAGTSVPEAVSSVIVTNQGHGSMGISNSIASNTFDVLLCLGLPWLIKSLAFPAVPGNFWVVLNSSGLTYSAVSLLTTLCGLYIAFAINKFRLDWKIGVACLFMYIIFLIFASLVELNFFFPVNLPTCDR